MSNQKTVTICGSMKFLNQMLEWQEKLQKIGYKVHMPTPTDFHTIRDKEGDLERFNEIKRRETKLHFERVKEGEIILIVNYEKNGKSNYIGGNTFAEIAVAVRLNYLEGYKKRIYTVNPLPTESTFYEELEAWQIRQIPQDLTNL